MTPHVDVRPAAAPVDDVALPPSRGFVAVSTSGAAPDLTAAFAAAGVSGVRSRRSGSLLLASWGPDLAWPTSMEPLLLSADPWLGDRQPGSGELLRLLQAGDERTLARLLPTFAAVGLRDEDTLVAATDGLGFRHVYLVQAGGWAALGTSSRVLAALSGATLDREAVAVQSLLGWQLGDRTLFAGVRKVPPGGLVTLARGVASTRVAQPELPARQSLDQAVGEAVDTLRGFVAAYLDAHDGVGLQLTGGQDSRILLSAIAPERRPEVRALTLAVPGNPDLAIAADIAAGCGMGHEIVTLEGLAELSTEAAYERCVHAAHALELGADPLARAALSIPEAQCLPGARLSGLGGEVARGFYYLGSSTTAPVTRDRTQRLVDWRMFANEAVTTEALEPEFHRWARDHSARVVHEVLVATGRPWLAATDELYLGQRMQRWAGVTETAGCLDRPVANPMLDARFIDIARSLAPEDKHGSLFLGRLQVALDTRLSRLPLDGRPAPTAYAYPGWASRAQRALSLAHKADRKVRQRLRGEARPPAGGQILAAQVVRHWRRHPDLLAGTESLGVFRPEWLTALVAGRVDVTPATAALLMNLTQAQAVLDA